MDLHIRAFKMSDEPGVIDLWERCNLIVPQNDPKMDIAKKLQVQPEQFIVGTISEKVVATAMAGFDGHRGWVYYLAVDPDRQRQGFGRQMMEQAEENLKALGCWKINLQVRNSNTGVIAFYKRIGYADDDVMGFGKRLQYETSRLDP